MIRQSESGTHRSNHRTFAKRAPAEAPRQLTEYERMRRKQRFHGENVQLPAAGERDPLIWEEAL